MMRGTCAGVAALLLAVQSARAHDFWIEPSTYRPTVGTTVDVALRLDDGRDVGAVLRNDDDIERFVLAAGDRVAPIAGAAGSNPAGRVAIPADGCWWVAYASRRAFSALAPAAFEDYLRQKGLDDVVTERQLRGESARYGTELYSRAAKALLNGRGCNASREARRQLARPVGLTLELITERNPSALHPGDELPVRVLFRGRPRAGVLLEAIPNGDRTSTLVRRTGADGRARVPLGHAGRWLLAAVHMERTTGPERADWESWWGSLSFELHGARWRELRFEGRRILPGAPVPIHPRAADRR